MDDSGHDGTCSCALRGHVLGQTLQELEFERGLWQAASDGDTERVQRLLASGHAVNATDSSGYSALLYACRSGHVNICQTLISAGAHLNCQTPGGATGLHRAAYCGHNEIVNLLVRNGADGGLIDSDGRTPLHKACEGGRLEVARELAAKFPDTLSVRDKRGNLPRNLVANSTELWTAALHSR